MTRPDPRPYDGPIARIDGTRPFNHYLWPIQGDWFHVPRGINSRYSFGVVALADGRWLADGHIDGQTYPDRTAAMRAAAARVIRTARNARHWSRPYQLTAQEALDVMAWVYSVLAQPAPALHVLPPPPRPAPTTLIEIMEA